MWNYTLSRDKLTLGVSLIFGIFQYLARLPLSCQTTDLIWNWKVLKRLKGQ